MQDLEIIQNNQMDDELRQLLEQSLAHLTVIELRNYISLVQRHDTRPVHIMYSNPGEHLIAGTERLVYWYHLRQDLEQFPKLFEAAEKVNLKRKDVVDIIIKFAEKYKNEDYSGPSGNIKWLTKFIEACAAKNCSFDGNASDLKKTVKAILKESDGERAFGIAALCVNAGMSPAQGLAIVKTVYETGWSAGYIFMGMYDDLAALATHNADPNKLYEVIQGINTKYSGQVSELAQILHLATTHTEFTQDEVLAKIIEHANPKTVTDSQLVKINKNINPLAATSDEILSTENENKIVIKKSPQDYFPEIGTEKIIHGILPYRVSRSLTDGVVDLKSLMASEYAEGAFIFDPQKETWYSFGGKTHMGYGKVRQEFFSYDVAKLSQNPVFVHIHPEQCETWLTPHRDSLPYPQMQIKLTKFLAAMPSGADYQTITALMSDSSKPVSLSAFIVTSTGITEFTFPNDQQKIQKFSETFRDQKDQTMLEFNARRYLAQGGVQEDDYIFVQRMLVILNAKLPKGFEIKQHAYNDLSALTQNQKYNATTSQPRLG